MNKTTLFAGLSLLIASTLNLQAQDTPRSQMEQLDRGLIVIPSGAGRFLSWRMLGTDDERTTRFDILRNGKVIKPNIYATNYKDATAGAEYQIVTKVNGVAIDTSKAVKAWSASSLTVNIQTPASGKTKPYTTTIDKETVSFPNGQEYSYSPNDMSVGDVDGDGQYELFVKWDPSNSKDNSQNGVTGIVYIDCYKLDGTFLWRIDLGKNIRAGAHYTQYMVYDFDGDGRAELMCKTAPGSKDGQGNYVNQAATDENIKAASNTKDWVSEGAGRINGGQEYLTVFNGLTGAAIHTIAYNPNRNAKSELSEAAGSFNWAVGKSDAGSYGNRGERYLAAVAYLDGTEKPASAVFCRGYYTYAFLWAVSFDGQQLRQRWLHKSDNTNGSTYTLVTYDTEGQSTSKTFTGCKPTSGSGSGTMYGNGNHNISVADVDGDGSDEIIWGSAACDNDGKLLYGTGFGHGDAIHIGAMIPSRKGLQVFDVHEEKGTYAWDLHDAATGEIIHKNGPEEVDNGRGIAGQFATNSDVWYFSSAAAREQRSAETGEIVSEKGTSLNFRVYWDADPQDELLDGNKIDKWNGNGTKRLATLNGNSCNSTKATPNLSADIFGDWREEVILWDGTTNNLIIYTPTTSTNYRVPTLMHDHTYRMAICWQNVAYNQPPHLGYNLAKELKPHFTTDKELTVGAGMDFQWEMPWIYAQSLVITESLDPDGNSSFYDVPEGATYKTDENTCMTVISGKLTKTGDYKISVSFLDLNGKMVDDEITIHVTDPSGIHEMASDRTADNSIFDLQGRQHSNLRPGLNIIRQGNKTKKVFIKR